MLRKRDKENTRVLIISNDLIGPSMAGSGIRYWELAKVLTQYYAVILAAPGESIAPGTEAEVCTYRRYERESIWPYLNWAEVILFPGDILIDFPFLAEFERPLIIDGYDPHTAENLLWALDLAMERRVNYHTDRLRLLSLQCLTGDFFICASEVQRDWWLGLLEAHGRINPYTFDDGPALRELVGVVPYGLSAEPVSAGATVDIPGIEAADRVLLWGGGLWEWLDPLTAIRALPRVLEQHSSVKLLFPGTRHPYSKVPDMQMVQRAQELVHSLGLSEHVIFGQWAPRDLWSSYLLRADVGLSLHSNTIESHLAFRSRLLDYVWAGLPMLVTGGDVFSEVVQEYQLGTVVDYEDSLAVAEGILRLLEQPKEVFVEGFQQLRGEMTWEKAAQPLIEFCRAPQRASDKIVLQEQLGSPFYLEEIAAQQEEIAAQQEEIAAQQEEIAARQRRILRLQELVLGYEQGKFIRLMRYLDDLKRRFLTKWAERTNNLS